MHQDDSSFTWHKPCKAIVSTPLRRIIEKKKVLREGYSQSFRIMQHECSECAGEQRIVPCAGEWGWGVEGKQAGSMSEEPQVRGCYNITFICTPTSQETV